MSIFRSYFNAQATLLANNVTNNSQNPIVELYRAEDAFSRYIFSVDLSYLRNKVSGYTISSGNVVSHVVNISNAIRYRPDLIGKTFVNGFLRDQNFALQLFTVDVPFTDGTGYDYIYSTGTTFGDQVNLSSPNWYNAGPQTSWTYYGVYNNATMSNITVLGIQYFTYGNEDICIDITQDLNNRLFNTTATTAYYGIAYVPAYETGITNTNAYITSFHSRTTNTVFEPYLETTYNDTIIDNRNLFYLDANNTLYLQVTNPNITVNNVEIYDYNGDLYTMFSGSAITQVSAKVYSIALTIPSSEYPDYVNFTDVWNYTLNGVVQSVTQSFSLFTQNILQDYIPTDNVEYYFSLNGIRQDERISTQLGVRRVFVNAKRLYGNTVETNIENPCVYYRVYFKQGVNEVDVIPFTQANVTQFGLYFDIDFSWFVEQTYYIQVLAQQDGITYNTPTTVKFSIVSP